MQETAVVNVWILAYFSETTADGRLIKEKSRNKLKKALSASQYTNVRPGFFLF